MYIHIYIYIEREGGREGLKYTKYIRQLETSLDAKERHWIWKLKTLTPQGLNIADTF